MGVVAAEKVWSVLSIYGFHICKFASSPENLLASPRSTLPALLWPFVWTRAVTFPTHTFLATAEQGDALPSGLASYGDDGGRSARTSLAPCWTPTPAPVRRTASVTQRF